MPSPKNWIKTDSTAAQWNTLVSDAGAVLSAVLLSNTTSAPISVQLRLATSGGSPLSTILPAHDVPGYGADVLNLRSLAIPTGQILQMYVGAAGIHAVASGVL